MKILLFQTSDTQRVTITKNEDGSWLLSKEWRHNNQEPWILGKGVLLPKQHVKAIGSLLETGYLSDDLVDCFSYIEGDEKSDFNRNQNPNNWNKTYTNYKQNTMGKSVC